MTKQGLLQYNSKLRERYFKSIENGYLKNIDEFKTIENYHSPYDITNKYTLMEYTHGDRNDYSKRINKKYINQTDDTTDYYSLIEDDILDLGSKYGRYENYLDYITNVYGNVDVLVKMYSEVSLMDTMGLYSRGLNDIGTISDINAFINYEDKVDKIENDTPMGSIAREMANIEEDRKLISKGNGYNSSKPYVIYSGLGESIKSAVLQKGDTEDLLTKNELYSFEEKFYKNYAVTENFTNNKYTPSYDYTFVTSNEAKVSDEKKRYMSYENDIEDIIKFYISDDLFNYEVNDSAREYDEHKFTIDEYLNEKPVLPLDKFTHTILEKENEYISSGYGYKEIPEKTNTTEGMFENGTEVDNIDKNLLWQTAKLFKEKKNKNISRARTLKNSQGTYYRSWSYKHKYEKYSDTIRGGNGFGISDLQEKSLKYRACFDYSEIENGAEYFKKNTVLLDDTKEMRGGIVRIVPSGDKYGNEMEHTMLSIENLAWKDVLKKDGDEKDLSKDQRGPNGGRIMWFPPYNLKFQENVRAQWNENSFIGRGENVYTYTNTTREATLSFAILIDHPSIINSLRKQAEENGGSKTEQDNFILNYFAGGNSEEIKNWVGDNESKDKSGTLSLGNTNVKLYSNNRDDEINDGNTGKKVKEQNKSDNKIDKITEALKSAINSLTETRRYCNEYEFFESLEKDSKFLYDNLVSKFKNFNPAFHSMSPEGFSARLTFLHQCTRQGHTISTSEAINEMTTSAANLSFGRMPVIVLRIGDFINTRAIIQNLSIDYSDTNWDLNPEGCGIQPMYAEISLGITMLGGQTMDAPVSRLQNAVSFNYYANTGVYDDRADRVSYNADTRLNYQYLYAPNMEVANNRYATIEDDIIDENAEEEDGEGTDNNMGENINGSGDAMSSEAQTSEETIEFCNRVLSGIASEGLIVKNEIDMEIAVSLNNCTLCKTVNSKIYGYVEEYKSKVKTAISIFENKEEITEKERNDYISKCNDFITEIDRYSKEKVNEYQINYIQKCS